MKHREQHHVGPLGPLRKVIGYEMADAGHDIDGKPIQVPKERLECGHLIGVKIEDIGGADRRRCGQCQRAGTTSSASA